MKHSLTIYALCLVGFCTFLLVRTTDFYKEFRDPYSYWTEQAARAEEMVRFYQIEFRSCEERHRQLLFPASRSIWLSQKKLEGFSPLESEADYADAVYASRIACETVRDLLAMEIKDLQNAQMKQGDAIKSGSRAPGQ